MKIDQSTPEARRVEIINEAKNEIGLLAQEVQVIFPEFVNYNAIDDVYSLDYTKLIPVLVKAVQEQQLLIEDLRDELDVLKANQ